MSYNSEYIKTHQSEKKIVRTDIDVVEITKN